MKKRWLAVLFVVVGLSAVFGLRELALALGWVSVVDRRGDELVVRGRLSQAAVEALLKADASQVRRVRITSPGGAEDAAIAIAEHIHRRGLDVIVTGVCFEECADYILPAGRTKQIEDGAVVACGANVLGAERLQVFPGTGPLRDRAQRARELYARIGVSEAYALVCFSRVVVCVASATDDGLFVHTSPRMWAPLDRDFEGLGVSGVEGAPAAAAEVRAPGWRTLLYGRRLWQVGQMFPVDYSKLTQEDVMRSVGGDITTLTGSCPPTTLIFDGFKGR